MGRGARPKVRWHNERVKKKKARDRRAPPAAPAGEAAAGEGQGGVPGRTTAR